MAYNAELLELQEPTLQYGVWTDVDLITPNDDPRDFFTPAGDFGYIRMGTIKVQITDTFVQYKSKTPHEMITEDLLERIYRWNFTANQMDVNNFQKLYSLFVQEGTWILGWIGPNTPVRVRYGFLARGRKRNGAHIYTSMWSGVIDTPDMSQDYTGNDYLNIPVTVQSFPSPDFTDQGPDVGDMQKYGMIFENAISS